MEQSHNTQSKPITQKRYTAGELFRYSGVSKLRIFSHLLLLGMWKILGRRYVTANVNGYKMRLDLQTPGLSRVLYVYGTRELPDVHIVRSVLKPGMVVADVGANIGYYTLLEASLVGETGHVYAFEPDPRNTPLLRDNVTLNGVDKQVSIYEKAISDADETKQFQLGDRSNVSSFVGKHGVVGSVDVECLSLNNFEHIEKIDMLRMDAEGYECKIIAGVMPYLERTHKPFAIMLEVHAKVYNETDLNFDAQLQALFRNGFSVSRIVANDVFREKFKSLGYARTGTWSETRHTRDVYQNIENEHVRELVAQGCVRAMLLSRN